VAYVGRLSYSLYLWHYLVFRVVDRHVAASATIPRVALGWTLTFLVSAASFRFVERPALRVKDRIGRRPAGVATPPQEPVVASGAYPATRP
jgi:peptidoglycan/LPS O-acetylase OafA/YrhL